MYLNQLFTVSKIENGYVIELRVPFKDDYDGPMCCSPSEDKQFFVKDAAELGEKIAALVPALEDKMDAEEAFKQTFKEAAADD